MAKADTSVVFELDDRHLEVSAVLPSGRPAVLKKGEQRRVTDPTEIAIWRGAKGVRVAKKPKRSSSSSTKRTSSSPSPQGAASTSQGREQ
jgi:adenine deaminase